MLTLGPGSVYAGRDMYHLGFKRLVFTPATGFIHTVPLSKIIEGKGEQLATDSGTLELKCEHRQNKRPQNMTVKLIIYSLF